MAGQVGSLGGQVGSAGGQAGGLTSSLGGLGGALQGTVQGAISQGQGFIDRFLPPERRADLWARFNKFATERPKLTAFILSHIAISGIPLGLFILMSITVAIFSIITALLVALLGALLFIVFAVGVALIFLLPTLFFTTMVATFIFLWGIGSYYLLKWFNEKKIPGIHTGFVEGIKGELLGSSDTPSSENDKLDALNPDASRSNAGSEQKSADGKTQSAGINGNRHAQSGSPASANKSEKSERSHDRKTQSQEHNDSPSSAKTTATDALSNQTKQRDIPKLASKHTEGLAA